MIDATAAVLAAGGGLAVARAASAGVAARALTATLTARLRSFAASAGVKRKPLVRAALPRRASAAASRGSATAGVNAPKERELSEGARRACLPACWEGRAKAGVSSSAIAISDAPPAAINPPSFFKTSVSGQICDVIRLPVLA